MTEEEIRAVIRSEFADLVFGLRNDLHFSYTASCGTKFLFGFNSSRGVFSPKTISWSPPRGSFDDFDNGAGWTWFEWPVTGDHAISEVSTGLIKVSYGPGRRLIMQYVGPPFGWSFKWIGEDVDAAILNRPMIG